MVMHCVIFIGKGSNMASVQHLMGIGWASAHSQNRYLGELNYGHLNYRKLCDYLIDLISLS